MHDCNFIINTQFERQSFPEIFRVHLQYLSEISVGHILEYLIIMNPVRCGAYQAKTMTGIQPVTFWGRLYEAWIAYPADKS